MFTFFDDTGRIFKGRVFMLVDAVPFYTLTAYKVFENGKYLHNSTAEEKEIIKWADCVIDMRVK